VALKKRQIDCLLAATHHSWASARLSDFTQRQPELKTRFQKLCNYQRARGKDSTIIRNWFKPVQNIIAKYGIRSDDVWNFDEIGFMMGVISSSIVVTGSERHGRPKSVQPGDQKWVTATQAINKEVLAIDLFVVVTGQYQTPL
jgi:hypothetical protein